VKKADVSDASSKDSSAWLLVDLGMLTIAGRQPAVAVGWNY
jgi:hypothetical protein